MSEKNKSSCVPAHKQDDHAKKPGQVRYNQDWPFPVANCPDLPKVKKKLTFDEWWHENNDDDTYYENSRRIWKAAQENK